MSTTSRYRGRVKAFTLIELLVVVSIIALLVSILLPALSKARQQAQDTLCLSNLRAIGNAWTMYHTENEDRVMPSWVGTGVWYENYYWPARLNPWLDSPKGTNLVGDEYVGTVAFCPKDRGHDYHSKTYSALSYLTNAFCGGDWDLQPNGALTLNERLTVQNPNPIYPVRTRLTQIKRPSEFFVLMDQKIGMIRNSFEFWNGFAYVAVRHNGSANTLLADSHAQRLESRQDPGDNSGGAWCSREVGRLMDNR